MHTLKSIILAFCAFCVINTLFAQQPALPAGHPPMPQTPSQGGGALSGKVVETMNAGDYTYVQVDTGTNKLWAAAPRFEVKKGDSVAIPAAMAMPKYHSKILNRDFDVVYFASTVSVNGGGAASGLPKGHPPIEPMAAGKPSLDLAGIKKAAGGNTVAEIYASQKNLNGKEVKVRGKVVKYNANIMGKNWLHIRDGSGTEGSNDLLVTTKTNAKLGDIVLVSGKVALNRDFGANYKYGVMIEDARVTVE
jgi:hypothetical protein